MNQTTDLENRYSVNHPSIILSAIPVKGCGGPEPTPAVVGGKAEYTLDRSPVYRRPDIYRQTNHSHSHSHLWPI